MRHVPVRLTINGVAAQGDVDPRTLLVDFIREQAGLTGTKRGCNEGKCGACTVILDGIAIKSCNMLAASADGSSVETIEGLGSASALHPIQTSFHVHHGLQCGFCTAGFVMMTKYLIDRGLEPDHAKIREAIHGNICRCTGYQKIVESIAAAISEAPNNNLA
jgi:aerobic-type carbon monoxide dehydrogenase small subunit (CoxS/CutS family)